MERRRNINDQFKIKDLINHYRIRKQDQGVFWAKLDCLLEICALSARESDYIAIVKKKWPNFFNNFDFDYNIINYIKKAKLAFKLMHEAGIDKVISDQFVCNIMISSKIKLLIIENLNYTKQEIYDKCNLEISQQIDDKRIMVSVMETLLNRYFAYGCTGAQLKDIFILCKNEMEQIFIVAARENYRRANQKLITKKNDSNEENQELKSIKEKYEFIIANKNLDIDSLRGELDYINKRERENFIFAMEQYSKAFKDLTQKINSSSYGNLLDRLFIYSLNDNDINLNSIKMILENFFIALKSLGLSTISCNQIGDEIIINPQEIGIKYRIDEGIKVNQSMKGRIKYPGWTFNDSPILPPFVELEGVKK